MNMIEQNQDIHSETAYKIFNKRVGVYRSRAKAVNFGLIYGIGDKALSNMLNLPLKEVKRIKQIFNTNRILESRN